MCNHQLRIGTRSDGPGRYMEDTNKNRRQNRSSDGANRGIGKALVEEALRRGAKQVYAGTRQSLAHPDGRVTPLTLDVTNAAQIQAAAERVTKALERQCPALVDRSSSSHEEASAA